MSLEKAAADLEKILATPTKGNVAAKDQVQKLDYEYYNYNIRVGSKASRSPASGLKSRSRSCQKSKVPTKFPQDSTKFRRNRKLSPSFWDEDYEDEMLTLRLICIEEVSLSPERKSAVLTESPKDPKPQWTPSNSESKINGENFRNVQYSPVNDSPKNPFLKGIEIHDLPSSNEDSFKLINTINSPNQLKSEPTMLTLASLENFKPRKLEQEATDANFVTKFTDATKSSNKTASTNLSSATKLPILSGKFGKVFCFSNQSSKHNSRIFPAKNWFCEDKSTHSQNSDAGELCSPEEDKEFVDPTKVTFEFETCLIPESCQTCSLSHNLKTTLNSLINGKLSSDDKLEENSPIDPKKYKTELCRPFQVHGYCKYGFRCNYAHGLNQLKVSFRHGKYKTRNCESYHKTGSCRYGARCSFIHDPEEGIMKCSITDREILEALHCHPSSNYIASITWRISNPLYPPSELYFFTPPCDNLTFESPIVTSVVGDAQPLPLVSSKSISVSTTVESCEETYVVPSVTYSVALPSIVCTDVSSTSEDDSVHNQQGHQFVRSSSVSSSASSSSQNVTSTPVCYSSRSEHSSPASSPQILNQLQQPQKIDEEESSFKSKGSFQNGGPGYKGYAYSKRGKLRSADYRDKTTVHHEMPNYHHYQNNLQSSCVVSSNQGAHSRTCSVPTFCLDDFLRCLKTDGQHHLASWSPERKLVKTPNAIQDKLRTPQDCKAPETKEPRRVLDSSKYKTELCRSYQYNRFCEYGDNCLYAHGVDDLRSYPKHPLFRTKKCFSFHHKGFCLYGSRCQFLHNVD